MSFRILILGKIDLELQSLKEALERHEYAVNSAASPEEAQHMISLLSPDLLLVTLDSNEINGNNIELVKTILKSHHLPFIYLAEDLDSALVKQALTTHPKMILSKPFNLSELTVNMDLAIINCREKVNSHEAFQYVSDSIFLPQQCLHYRIRKKEILYVEADGSYVKVFTRDKKYQVSVNLKSFEQQLNDRKFLRISRKHIINTEYITRINGNALYLQQDGGKENMVAISKDQRQNILRKFSILKT